MGLLASFRLTSKDGAREYAILRLDRTSWPQIEFVIFSFFSEEKAVRIVTEILGEAEVHMGRYLPELQTRRSALLQSMRVILRLLVPGNVQEHKTVDWEHSRISIGYSITQALPETTQTTRIEFLGRARLRQRGRNILSRRRHA